MNLGHLLNLEPSQQLLDNCKEIGIVVVDNDLTITFCNDMAAKIFSTSKSHIQGSSVDKVCAFSKLIDLIKSYTIVKRKVIEYNNRLYLVDIYPIQKTIKSFKSLISIFEYFPPQSYLATEFTPQSTIDSIIGNNLSILKIKETIPKIASKGSNVLIIGESGTGKDVIAHSICSESQNNYAPFYKINCSALTDNFQQFPVKGTVVLDNIGEISLIVQGRLVKILQNIESIKASSPDSCFRIIACTQKNLENMVETSKFRKDLYYYLNVVNIHMPSLRDRLDDMQNICRLFIERYNNKFDHDVQGLSYETEQLFKAYHWPGNVRELRNIVERAMNVTVGSFIKPQDLPKYILDSVKNQNSGPKDQAFLSNKMLSNNFNSLIGNHTLSEITEQFERAIIQQALIICKGNKVNTANLLGISRPGLYKKLQKYQLE